MSARDRERERDRDRGDDYDTGYGSPPAPALSRAVPVVNSFKEFEAEDYEDSLQTAAR